MSTFKMSQEEKKKISQQHKDAIKTDLIKKDDLKKGLKKPEEEKRKPPNRGFFVYVIIWNNRYINQKRIPQYNTMRNWLSINSLSVILGNTARHRTQKD